MRIRPLVWLTALIMFLSACNFPGGAVAEPQATLPAPAPATSFPPVEVATGAQPPPVEASQAPVQPPPAAITLPPVSAPPVSAPPASAPPVSAPAPGLYAVIGVGRSDTLNMRLAPGVQAKIVDQLSYDAVNIMLTGQAQTVDGRLWVEAQRLHGSGSGWLNASYLTEYIPPAVFCADQRALALLDQTAQAFQKQDGEQLAGLVSPRHGLDVAYLRMGRVVNYAPSQVKWLFESTYAMQWGNHPGSGNPLRGAFHTLVLPDLMDVFNAPHETHCNSLALGGHSYIVERRAIYQNINYYALYRPGPPGEELNWRTWVVGVEYVQGQPMLFALDHFFWEP